MTIVFGTQAWAICREYTHDKRLIHSRSRQVKTCILKKMAL